jgi:hypothetical protein
MLVSKENDQQLNPRLSLLVNDQLSDMETIAGAVLPRPAHVSIVCAQ